MPGWWITTIYCFLLTFILLTPSSPVPTLTTHNGTILTWLPSATKYSWDECVFKSSGYPWKIIGIGGRPGQISLWAVFLLWQLPEILCLIFCSVGASALWFLWWWVWHEQRKSRQPSKCTQNCIRSSKGKAHRNVCHYLVEAMSSISVQELSNQLNKSINAWHQILLFVEDIRRAEILNDFRSEIGCRKSSWGHWNVSHLHDPYLFTCHVADRIRAQRLCLGSWH